jgi:pimeloyl-ACP methyl ester carboxylesterase
MTLFYGITRSFAVIGIGIIVSSSLNAQQPRCDQGGCTTSATIFQAPQDLQVQAPPSLANNLSLFRTFLINGDYVVAGVGLRGTGRGTISMRGVLSGSKVAAAYLYWETLGNGQNGTFNNKSVQGVRLGTVTSPCWAPPFIDAYRADVSSLLNVGGNGDYFVTFPDSGNFSVAPSTEGATLVIVYTRADLPSRGIVLYDGAYTQTTGTPSFDLMIQGFTRAASSSPQAKVTHIVGDGQPFGETLSFNGTVLGSATNPFGGAQGPLWDNSTFDVSALVQPKATSVTTSVRWPAGIASDCLTWGAVLFSTTVDGGNATDLLDPVSQLMSGANIITPSTASNISTLATKGISRKGIASDGVAQLVARFNAPSAGRVIFSLTDENGIIASSSADYGSLTDLFGQPLSGIVSIPTFATTQGPKAWARYTAPTHFVRELSLDANLSQRTVYLNIRFIPTVGPPQDLSPVPIMVVRPPVMLVHGLWETEGDWANFPLPSSRDCTDSGQHYTCRIDYSDKNSDNLAVIAPIVGLQIRDKILQFRSDKSVAAIQANVIGHSMGGLVPRVLPLCGTTFKDCSFSYLASTNFNAGDIGRLITIGTPHQGSPLADHLWQNRDTKCCPIFCSTLGSHFADRGSPIGPGVENLQPASGALSGLNSTASPFPISFFVGVATANDEQLFNNGLIDAVRSCSKSIIPADVRTGVFGQDSDLIVSVASQRYGLSEGANGTVKYTPTVHSSGVVWKNQTGFSTDEYHLQRLGNDAVTALDTGVFIKK